MDHIKNIRIGEILLLSFEGHATREDFLELDRILDGDKKAIEYYVECLIDFDYFYSLSDKPLFIPSELSSNKEFYSTSTQNDQMDILMSLVEYEKTAPAIEILKEKPKRELIQKVVYPQHEKFKYTIVSFRHRKFACFMTRQSR